MKKKSAECGRGGEGGGGEVEWVKLNNQWTLQTARYSYLFMHNNTTVVAG